MGNSPKAILVVSDIHAGSIFGMHPPDFRTSDEKVVEQNAGQRFLWQCWLDMIARVTPLNISAVVVNGDVVDGMQQAQKSTEMSLPMVLDQCLAAEEILMPLKKATLDAKWYWVQGTEYHVGKAARDEEAVARALGAKQYNGAGTGRWSREVLDLDVDGVHINFAHHVGTTSGFYKATSIDREGAFASMATRDKIDGIVRSHVHTYIHTEYPRRHNLTTPCWQLQTRFMRKHSVYRMLPDIGALVLWVNGKAKAEGEDPIKVQKILYKLPPVVHTKL